MGSILRFLALAGVISVGSYMLYQAERRLSESESLTHSETLENAPISLGESSGNEIPSLEHGLFDQDEPENSSVFVYDSDDWNDAPEVAELDQDPESSRRSEFRSSGVTTADLVTTENDPFAAIQRTSNEEPFESDDEKKTADEFPPLDQNSLDDSPADPFAESPVRETVDPFGEFPPLKSPEKQPAALPELNIPLPDEFPDLEKQEPDSPDPFEPLPSPGKAEPAKPIEPPAKSADPFEALPVSNEPNPFEESDMFDAVKPNASTGAEFGTIVTPRGSARDTNAGPASSFQLPKITPKPKQGEPAPFVKDDRLPAIGPNRGLPNPESDPFAADPPSVRVAPASAEEAFPLITPKPKSKEIDPFAEEAPERKTPDAFPETFERTSSPAPTQLDDAFPLPEPTPSDPFEAPAAVRQPLPAPDAFPALDEFPAVEAPEVADPFGETNQPAPTEETPLDDSFHFPPLPKAIPDGSPSTLKAPAEEFPSLDPIDTPAPTTTSPAPNEFDANPLPEDPIPNIDDLVSDPQPLPELPSELGPGELKQPGAPKEFRETAISQPIEPRTAPVPQLVIEKLAPDKAVLQQPFVYHIVVKNTGQTPVSQVTVQDQVPHGTKLTGTIPQAELSGQRLLWKLDRMQPGEERKISVRVIPEQSGPIGSVATVNFVAEVGSETVIEPPKLEFRAILPAEARVGEVVTCRFEIENKGDQTITGLVLRDVLPEGLYHPSGNDLENPLGDLKPGDRIVEQLQLKITKAGEIINTAYLGAEGGLRIEATARVSAKPSRLTITRKGPKQRLVGRMAIYHNLIKNISDNPVSGAMVIEQLPQGMEFVSANEEGEFHEKGRTIFWKLPVLQPGTTIVLQSKVIPHEEGTQESLVRVVESTSSKSEIQTISHTVVEPAEALGIAMSEHQQPVLIGDSVIMTIEATNRGNRSAENVRIRAAIPPSLHLMNVRGETRFRIEGREVVFEPLNELVPGNKEIIQLELKAAASATAKVNVTIQSNQMKQPVEKASALSVQSVVR